MKLGLTLSPGLRRFIGDTLYETFEHIIMLILTLIIVVLIGFATYTPGPRDARAHRSG